MMLGFPEDLRCDAIVAKSVSEFGIMVHWHESLILARVIVKVYLNDDRKIPSSVKINAGLPSKGRSWTVPVFLLKKKNVIELPDEEGFVTVGPLHPMPPQPPRWSRPTPPARYGTTPAASNVGDVGMQIDAAVGDDEQGEAAENVADNVMNMQPHKMGLASESLQVIKTTSELDVQSALPENAELAAPQFVACPSLQVLQDGNLIIHGSDFDDSRTITDRSSSDLQVEPTPAKKPRLKSVVVRVGSPPAVELEAPPNVQRKLFAEVSSFVTKHIYYQNFFCYLTLCDIDPDLEVPTFFADVRILAHILCIMPPQMDDPACESDMVDIMEEDDEVVEILRPSNFPTRKKRNKKLSEPLPSEFLRRSKRQALKTSGFKGKSAVEVLSPRPLAMIPASPAHEPAPHLNRDIVEGIATGFLQIHPTDVSDALIKLDSNEDDN